MASSIYSKKFQPCFSYEINALIYEGRALAGDKCSGGNLISSIFLTMGLDLMSSLLRLISF